VTDALGGFLEPAQSPRVQVARALVFLGVLLLSAVLERLQTRLREMEISTWWVSNSRDVLNVFALASCALGLRLLGFRGPLALCLAAILALALSLLQGLIVARRLPYPVSLLAALGVGLPVALWPAQVAAALKAGIELLF
jgi:uncharacterized membrane protein